VTQRDFIPSGLIPGVLAAAALLAACTPTVKVEVAPINIYAKLDADVRVRLDREVQDLIRNNPEIF
jgi:hypothetical protein